jgi:hypothetical protein
MEKKAVIKSADMAEDVQQDVVDLAAQVSHLRLREMSARYC